MGLVNCVFPMRVVITGTPDDEQLEELAATLGDTVRSRVAFAQRELAARLPVVPPALFHPPMVRFSRSLPEIDEARMRATIEDGVARGLGAETASPRFVTVDFRTTSPSGGPRPPAPGRTATAAPWLVRSALRFHLRLRDFAALMDRHGRSSSAVQSLRALYADRLDEIVPAAVWLVVARRTIAEEELVEGVRDRIARFVDDSTTSFYYVYSALENDRQRLQLLDARGELGQLPDLTNNPAGVLPDGRVFLRPGGRMLFTFVSLPAVQLHGNLLTGPLLEVPARLRDLGSFISGSRFEAFFGVTWANYLDEFGDTTVTLSLQTFTTQRAIHVDTIRALMGAYVSSGLDVDTSWLGRTALLNQSTIDALPSAARAAVAPIVSASDLAIPADRTEGVWERGWTGALIYSVLAPRAGDVERATYAPEARRSADRLVALLRADRSTLIWPSQMLQLLRDGYLERSFRPTVSRATAFEYLLAELERRDGGRWFAELFDAVEAARYGELHALLVRLAVGTRFAQHARVQSSARLLNQRRRSYQTHTYDAVRKDILIDRNPNTPLRVGMFAWNVDPAFTVTKEAKQLRSARLRELQQAADEESKALLGRVLRGEDSQVYTQETFAKAALGAAAKRIQIKNEDFEDLVIERTVRLRDVELRIEDGIERYYITYDYFERVNEGNWSLVPNSLRVSSDSDFEYLLWSFRYEKEAAFITAVAIGVSIFAVLVIAWEVGAIAFLIEAGGGLVNIGLSIAISELIYVCTTEHRTVEGYLWAAAEGYLFAVGFRGAGVVGRALARQIGTETVQRVVLGWIAERLAVGAIGGASSAGLILFSHDLLDVALGRKEGFSSPGDYIRHMALGAAMGIAFEFALGPVGVVLRSVGRTGIDTAAALARRIHAEGISVTSWLESMQEAVQTIRRNTGEFLDRVRAGDLGDAFSERVDQVTQALRDLRQTAIFQRVLELADIPLTREVSRGLDRLLVAAEGRLTNQELLALLNRLRTSPLQLRRFLEALQMLDETVVRGLGERGQLTAFSRAVNLHGAILEHGDAGIRFFLEVFGGNVTRAEQYLVRISARGPAQRAIVITVLVRAGQRVSPEGLALTLERLGEVSAPMVRALDRLYGSAERAAADEFLQRLTPERFARVLTFVERLGPAFVEVPHEALGAGALRGLDRVLLLAAARVGDDALVALLNRLRGNPARLRQFLQVFETLEEATVTQIMEHGQLAAVGDAANVVSLLGERGAAGWELVTRYFAEDAALAEPYARRLFAQDAAARAATIDILLRAGQHVTPEGAIQATTKLPAITPDIQAGLDRMYATAVPPADLDAVLINADAAGLQNLLPFLGGLAQPVVGNLAANNYLPALAASPRALAWVRAGRNLGRLFRFVGRTAAAPDQLVRTLERFNDIEAAFAELTGRGATAAELDVAAQIDRPAYPGGSGRAVQNVAQLVGDDVQLRVATEMLRDPAGVNIANVEVAGPGVVGPDVIFTLDTGRSIGREAVHTESRGNTVGELLVTVTNSITDKIRDFTANARGLVYQAREVHLQVRPGPAGVDFDPMLTPGFFADVVALVGPDLATIEALVIYDSTGAIRFRWP